MVCELVCLPAIAILTFIAKALGLSETIVSFFMGALTIGLAEISSKMLKKVFKKGDNEALFPFQTAIITLIYLICMAVLLNLKIIK